LSPNEREQINQLRRVLDAAGANYAILTHNEAVTSAEEGVEKGFGDLGAMAPTLILNTEEGYVAAIISGGTRLSYKKIKKKVGLKNASLAKPEQVQQATGAQIGAVALVNPGLRTIVDRRLTELDSVYGGCGVSRHSLQIRVKDLIAVTRAQVFDFTELKVSEKH